uniref:COesterase domain-containing protein n=1 Tax=Ascaris lumbricoides TaxID=6252 RepID=A0A0M3HL94_ASCLU
MLVYSGDLDTVCNFIGGLLFSPSNIDKSGSLVYLVSYKGHSAKHK